ncbi:S-formylglutathione hydrolase [Vibrio sp. S9_S30]|uniref:S-formylglutathione hydrolase n=1 Tax=Vibrio sp. S9_S30 TaxID=2720226 RepID=UPI001680421E|nr:S-formylglutathione hydrolase [Vibrio sp. S9_S30]MBD1555910.1 S-formylglutathione hydrolase [Vibrio sp. S9_S30]
MAITEISAVKVHGGWHKQFTHQSDTVHCEMRFAIFLPPQAQSEPVPVLYWLSGLTCTDENFMQKAAAFRQAAELGIAIVAPDTSPRGEGVPDDPEEAYDFGLGAGFYLNATQEPWCSHYHMYDYVVKELPALIEANFQVNTRKSIAGHSMGGHGALSIGLKNGGSYRSISAFSPITNPMNCPWGIKAFTLYLGDDKANWSRYDSCELLSTAENVPPILIDQGSADSFLEEQLKPDAFQGIAKRHDNIVFRMQDGYDHSYFFIQSFIEEHIAFHARYLK